MNGDAWNPQHEIEAVESADNRKHAQHDAGRSSMVFDPEMLYRDLRNLAQFHGIVRAGSYLNLFDRSEQRTSDNRNVQNQVRRPCRIDASRCPNCCFGLSPIRALSVQRNLSKSCHCREEQLSRSSVLPIPPEQQLPNSDSNMPNVLLTSAMNSLPGS